MAPLYADEGFTKFPNTLRQAPWRNKPKTVCLYFWLRMNANHFQTGWNGITVEAGELITGRKRLADETGLTQDEVRTALNHLKSTGYITIKTTNKYSLISFMDKENWNDERDIFPSNIPITLPNNSPASPQQVPTERDLENIETKRLRECGARKRFTPPTIKEVEAYCRERGNNVDAQRFVDHYTTNGWRRGNTPIKDWRACVRTWERSEGARQNTTPSPRNGLHAIPTAEEYAAGVDPSGFGWA